MTREYVSYSRSYPPVPDDASTRFWSRALNDAKCTASTAARYIQHFEEYLDATYAQAVDRGNQYIRPQDEYFAIRRPGSGAHPSIDLIIAKHDLPDEIYEGEFMQKALKLGIDLILMINVRLIPHFSCQ